MNKEKKITTYEEENRKEKFDSILENIKEISEAIKLHNDVKEAVLKEEVDNNYLKYIENSLEDKLFNDVKFDKIKSKVLLEIICPNLTKIENFEIQKLEIIDIGNHFEELENYIDKICTYDGKFVCLFGINGAIPEKSILYKPRKFSRTDIIEAICEKIEEGKTAKMEQYDEYYVITDENGLKVFSERKMTALSTIEETVFYKIKSKLTNMFNKKKYLPNIQLVYDANPNRFKDFKYNTSKIDAKNRMKVLLTKEREVTRNANI